MGAVGTRARLPTPVIFIAAFAAAERGSRACQANIAASAASRSGRAGSRRTWLRLA